MAARSISYQAYKASCAQQALREIHQENKRMAKKRRLSQTQAPHTQIQLSFTQKKPAFNSKERVQAFNTGKPDHPSLFTDGMQPKNAAL